jgi:hypothetical protein
MNIALFCLDGLLKPLGLLHFGFSFYNSCFSLLFNLASTPRNSRISNRPANAKNQAFSGRLLIRSFLNGRFSLLYDVVVTLI